MPLARQPVVQRLLASTNPTIRFKSRVNLLGEPSSNLAVRALRAEIGSSWMARAILSGRGRDGRIPVNPYRKWQGALWTLVQLALIEYPAGDTSLCSVRDQAYDWLLSPEHLEFPRSMIIPGQEDRVRRCASQEAFVIWSTLKLGLADERTDLLIDRLVQFQWPDGGWNCDKRLEARKSSLVETLHPIRALSYYGSLRQDRRAALTARRAGEVVLKRQLFRRASDGTVIHPSFTRLAYPCFYPYNILSALVILAEADLIHDPRCRAALDLLESKRLPDGGFPLEMRLSKTTKEFTTRGTFADWGPVGRRRMNEFVTVDALYALKAAGRIA